MIDRIVKYAPYAMALMIGLIANRVIFMLQLFTNNETISNIIGLLFGIIVLLLWKFVYYKVITKKQNDNLNQYK